MDDQRLPNGECAGKDAKDCGVMSGVTDTYGAKRGDLARGYTGGGGIGKDTSSDAE